MATVQVTTCIGCKNACSYCPQNTLLKAYQKRSDIYVMSFDSFRACFDKVPVSVGVLFAGMCEPWQNPECSKMLMHANEKGHQVSVFTTLKGMKETDISLIESVPFGFFRVHVPSIEKTESIPVNQQYLDLLKAVLQSRIQADFHFHGRRPILEIESLIKVNKKTFTEFSIKRRAGNVKIDRRIKLGKKRGILNCTRKSKSNVLLPNGEVLICSNDYGMKHVLGNLLSDSYKALFESNEYSKVLAGQGNESIDVLCRYCDNFSYSVDFPSKLKNWRYNLDRYLYYIRGIHSSNDARLFLRKFFSSVKQRLKPS